MPEIRAGDEVWTPTADLIEHSAMTEFRRWLGEAGPTGTSYHDLWQWSVDDIGRFWQSIFDFESIMSDAPPSTQLVWTDVEHVEWFPGVRLNFAEHVFRDRDPAAIAVDCVGESGSYEVSWGELKQRVAQLAATLTRLGVGEGDRVAGYLPNAEAAVVGLLAAASIGAVWSVCSPDLGVDGVVARLSPLAPTVLIAVDGYRYSGKPFDRSREVSAILAGIPTVRTLVWVSVLGAPAPSFDGHVLDWHDAIDGDAELSFRRVDFSAPLWVLFSSGTTGSPKGIVHGHGGTLLEQFKQHHLHFDERPGDRFLYLGSTSWMVWNLMVSALLTGTTIVLVDGNPIFPTIDRPFEIAAQHGVTQLGVGAGLVHAAMKAGISPKNSFDLSSLRNISITGSPLSIQGFGWLRDHLPEGLWQSAASGGTDICSSFVGGTPLVPTLAGRFQATSLGVALESWSPEGRPLIGERGELVVTKPMPSMPLYFFGDTDGSRLHDSYFSTFPGVWRHGDFITIYPDGSSAIHGRSDATLNRHGVRIGPADISAVVEQLDSVRESLIVGIERDEDYDVLMFVTTTAPEPDDTFVAELCALIRQRLSPRHVPDQVMFVSAIPHTKTGKKLEIPVKRLFQGERLDAVIDLSAVDDAETLHAFARLAETWIATPRPA
jgi:acetoacetyl-CoA synthetase